jgi:hypothetical protein
MTRLPITDFRPQLSEVLSILRTAAGASRPLGDKRSGRAYRIPHPQSATAGTDDSSSLCLDLNDHPAVVQSRSQVSDVELPGPSTQ